MSEPGAAPRAGRADDRPGASSADTPTPVALATYYLQRIAELNPILGAVTTVSPDALSEAAARDQESPASRGPLHGVPVLVKDNIDVRGLPATAGSPALGGGADRGDAFLVTRLREAGAVILGKANLSEWANFRSPRSTSGWSTLGGQAANPHALDRNPSGSSSGSGVAVAAGLAPMAIGTETDGSIVCPASACGVVGIKPTLGLVSRHGIVPISSAQDTAGPMARTVAEAAALLGVLAGPDPADPVTAAAAGRPADYTAFLDAGALAGARLGVWRDGCHEAGDTIMAVLDAALDVLRDLGATVLDPVELPGAAGISDPEWVSLLHEFKREINGYLRAVPGHAPRSLAELIDFNIDNGPSVLAHFGHQRGSRRSGRPGGAGGGGQPRPGGAGRPADQSPARRHRHADREPGVPDRLRAGGQRRVPHLRAVRGGRVPRHLGPGGPGQRAAGGPVVPRPGVERAGPDRPGVRVRAGVAGAELAVPAGHRAVHRAGHGAGHPGRPRGAAEITCAHGLLAWRKHS